MRSVIQRISQARVEVEGVVRARCDGPGLLVLAGLEAADTDEDLKWTAEKIAYLRIFSDDAGKMNRSVIDVHGRVVLVPNFTLAGEAARGRRPSFDNAMRPELSEPAFARLAGMLAALGPPVETGVFRAHMSVTLCNDGPITIWLDSKSR
ncbi:MAG TPA: D-aminoacyl-tRNA deacylase [Phycisphaerales bacterium]|nr:D-aminoacyl-tRNA deacylase [Phycisphaerales bacterium]